jgi:hypothetical protein
MPPKPYYDVQPSAYLFVKNCNEKPEEKVRQWALFELLSTYGVFINNIEIERQVKVGTRNHYADIVILRNRVPFVVIECKKWDAKKNVGGMQQALSYADANTMKAKYAVYTNGNLWEVKSKIGGEWVSIPELPKKIDGDCHVKIDELLSSINDFKPAFYWLNQSVPAASAQTYFSCLQRIFYGATYPLNYLNKGLCFGTDNLLRVICAKGDHPDYLHSKMYGACKSFADYFKNRIGEKTDYDFRDDKLRQLTVHFKSRFERLVDNIRDLQGEEIILIRFIATLLQYLLKQTDLREKKKLYIDIPLVLTKEFQELVAFLFQVQLGITFPDPVLEESWTDLRYFCRSAWESFEKENK